MPTLVDTAPLDADGDTLSSDETTPCSVTVTRTSQSDFGSRQMIVWIDGMRIATLMWGDSITTELPPGRHKVRVSNTLVWKSITFDIRPGEQVFFETINRTGPLSYTMLLIFGSGPLYVTLRRMI